MMIALQWFWAHVKANALAFTPRYWLWQVCTIEEVDHLGRLRAARTICLRSPKNSYKPIATFKA